MIRATLEPKSNRETFTEDIELFRDYQQLDLTGITAKIQLERADQCSPISDYTLFSGFTEDLTYAPKLLATTENGAAVIVASSSIRFTFTAAQMATLPAGQYRLSAIALTPDGTITKELFQYQIPILDGGLPIS